MAGKGRASLGFGDELDDIDPSAWAKPKTRDDKPAPEVTRQAAEATAGWVLVSCVVTPGFDFAGFELAPPGWSPSALDR